MAIKYLVDIYDKRDPKKRWIKVDYCKDCPYQRARDLTYDKPLTS